MFRTYCYYQWWCISHSHIWWKRGVWKPRYPISWYLNCVLVPVFILFLLVLLVRRLLCAPHIGPEASLSLLIKFPVWSKEFELVFRSQLCRIAYSYYFYFPFKRTLNGNAYLQISHSRYFVLKYIVHPFIFLWIFDAIHCFKQHKCINSHDPIYFIN